MCNVYMYTIERILFIHTESGIYTLSIYTHNRHTIVTICIPRGRWAVFNICVLSRYCSLDLQLSSRLSAAFKYISSLSSSALAIRTMLYWRSSLYLLLTYAMGGPKLSSISLLKIVGLSLQSEVQWSYMSGEIQSDGIRWLPYYDVVNLNDLHAFHVCNQSQMVIHMIRHRYYIFDSFPHRIALPYPAARDVFPGAGLRHAWPAWLWVERLIKLSLEEWSSEQYRVYGVSSHQFRIL